MNVIARLELGNDATTVHGNAEDGLPLQVAPGVERLVREQLSRTPMSLAMENAIAAIEDELARVPLRVRGMLLASNDPRLREIAAAAGVGAAPGISREAVEQVFARLPALAIGRTGIVEGLPDDPAFDAAVLIVRELMHHLDIPTIQLREYGSPTDRRCACNARPRGPQEATSSVNRLA